MLFFLFSPLHSFFPIYSVLFNDPFHHTFTTPFFTNVQRRKKVPFSHCYYVLPSPFSIYNWKELFPPLFHWPFFSFLQLLLLFSRLGRSPWQWQRCTIYLFSKMFPTFSSAKTIGNLLFNVAFLLHYSHLHTESFASTKKVNELTLLDMIFKGKKYFVVQIQWRCYPLNMIQAAFHDE